MEDREIMDWLEGRIRHHVSSLAGLSVGPAQDRDGGTRWVTRALTIHRDGATLAGIRIMADNDTENRELRGNRGGVEVPKAVFTEAEIKFGNRDAADAKIKRFVDAVLTSEPHSTKSGLDRAWSIFCRLQEKKRKDVVQQDVKTRDTFFKVLVRRGHTTKQGELTPTGEQICEDIFLPSSEAEWEVIYREVAENMRWKV